MVGTLLERVLAQGFEVSGTHCHLARIAMFTGDSAAAADHAARAWTLGAETARYVLLRILWLQLAARLLAGPASAEPDPRHLLGRLKTALEAEGPQMEWTMDPVIDHLKPRLSPADHALLVALSFPDKVAVLEDLPAWHDAEAQPLD